MSVRHYETDWQGIALSVAFTANCSPAMRGTMGPPFGGNDLGHTGPQRSTWLSALHTMVVADHDVLYLNTGHLGAPYEWHYTKDHSKWGISEKDDWVCIADITA